MVITCNYLNYSSDNTDESAARCRIYERDEHKISVIFEMMKKKCIKSDSEKGGMSDIPPNTTVVNVPYNSLPVSGLLTRSRVVS